jgi:hypothetical protein
LHYIQAATTYAGNEFHPTDNNALFLYETCCGYVNGQPNTDNGCVIEDVLNYVQANGIDGNGLHQIKAFMSFDITNVQLFEDAVYLFDGVSVGIQMPISAQNQTGPGLVWDVNPNGSATGNYAPGSWGGHAVPILAFDHAKQIVWLATWGAVQQATYAFLKVYCDEAYAVLTNDELNTQGLSPENFDMAQLQADLQDY